MTAEEYLRQDVGALIASLLFQNALLKAENESLRPKSQERETTLVDGAAIPRGPR